VQFCRLLGRIGYIGEKDLRVESKTLCERGLSNGCHFEGA
jgi:hypothetical protein